MKKSTNILIGQVILTLITVYVTFVMDLPETVKTLENTMPGIKFSEMGIKLFFAIIWLVTLPLSLLNYFRAADQENLGAHLYQEFKSNIDQKGKKKKKKIKVSKLDKEVSIVNTKSQ